MKNKKNVLSTLLIYFLVFYLIGKTDITFFRDNRVLDVIMLLFATLLFGYYKRILNKEYLILLSVASIIIAIQILFFGGEFLTLFTKVLITFVTPYLILKIIGLKQFIERIIDITVFFTITSLIFWITENVIPSFNMFLKNIVSRFNLDPAFGDSIIVYSAAEEKIKSIGLFRNSGIWHEPGAFAILVITALLFNFIKHKRIFNRNGIILTIGLASTFSTAGYITYFIFIVVLYLLNRKMDMVIKSIVILFVFIISSYAYFNIDFLGQKIDTQYKNEMERKLTDTGRGRFFGVRREIATIFNHPLYGRGIIAATMPKAGSGEAVAYGTFALGATIGLIPFIILLFLFYKSCRLITKLYGREQYAFLIFMILFIANIPQSVIFRAIYTIIILVSTMGYRFKYKQNLV